MKLRHRETIPAALRNRFGASAMAALCAISLSCSDASQTPSSNTASSPSSQTNSQSEHAAQTQSLPAEPARDTELRPGLPDSHAPGRADTGVGRWRKLRMAAPPATGVPTGKQREMIEQLEAIGYVSGSREALGRGVTSYRAGKVDPGFNLYTSGHKHIAILMDMQGRELHQWSLPFDEVWPDPPISEANTTEFWRRAHLFPNGDLLAIVEGQGIIKLDKDSTLLWASHVGAHHDLDVMPDGDIYLLTRTAHVIPRMGETAPILEDFISVLASDGREKRRISLLEAFENSDYMHLLEDSPPSDKGSREAHTTLPGDILHTNSLEILAGPISQGLPAFAVGRALISLRTPSVLAVVDLEQERVVWARKGDFLQQHDPKLLENGNLLFFDNLGRPGRSRVIEVDPLTMQTQWQYRGSKKAPFFSHACGAAERLRNGNTLITESDNGRAFEVTPKGEIVWEFYNPHRGGKKGQFIASLFEVIRLPADFPIDWSAANSASPRLP